MEHWANGGETSLENLVNVCSFHNRFVHEYGYRVELDEHQQPRFFDQRGRLVTEHAPRTPLRWSGMATIVDAHRDLDVSAETNEPHWDGHRRNYGWIIDDLVRVDGLQERAWARCALSRSGENRDDVRSLQEVRDLGGWLYHTDESALSGDVGVGCSMTKTHFDWMTCLRPFADARRQ
ncbi:MAG: hypothetical protein ACKV2T_39405 [Kofleriaceae bacterium]